MLRKLVIVAVMALGLLVVAAPMSDACCHRSCCYSSCNSCCYSCCRSCCYTPCCYTYCGGCCYTYGSGGYVAYTAAPAYATTARATVVVNLPENAKLTVNGTATSKTSATREFVTPAIEIGKAYVYTMKAEIVRDGENQVVTKEVTVRAGQTSNVSFDFPVATAAK